MTRDALLLELEAAREALRQHEQTLRERERELAVERARRTAAEQALAERAIRPELHRLHGSWNYTIRPRGL